MWEVFGNRIRLARPDGAGLAAVAVALAAALGCSPADPQANPERGAAAPPFEPLRMLAEPNQRSTFGASDAPERTVNHVKPGHWTSVLVHTMASEADFGGRLTSVAQDTRQRPIDLEGSPFWLVASRGISLPKLQPRTFATLFFPPRPAGTATSKTSTWFGGRLVDGGGREVLAGAELLAHMPAFQYNLIVLAREPARYGYLKVLDSVQPPGEFTSLAADDASHYRVVLARSDQPLALAREVLCWSSTAYVVWDDVLPGVLDPDQQQALIDWLHWGGGLIISGPDSLDKLRGSFLAEYLPADAGSAGPLAAAKLAAWGSAWTVAADTSPAPQAHAGAWSGIELLKRPEAQFLPGAAELVAERRVGRGRVVVTAFRLSEPQLLAWRSFDSFFNAGLLRRPQRAFDARRGIFRFAGFDPAQAYDPRPITPLRFFTRDAADPRALADAQDDAPTQRPRGGAAASPQPEALAPDALDRFKAASGVAAWDDGSWISNVSRQTLREAAGIIVPRRTFVLKMIGLYLAVVVGLNWLVFRLLGRVEWAWAAVPLIALLWGVLVVWLAQLDIGFARSETEVAVLEVQGDYPRAHLTRYLALYSSLSTTYDVHFENRSALALPFATPERRLADASSIGVTLAAAGPRALEGMPVASNSTGMVHSEEMVALGGSLGYDGAAEPPALENGTSIALSGAVVTRRRSESGRVVEESAWVGDLPAGARCRLTFQHHTPDAWRSERNDAALSRDDPPLGALSLRRLIVAAADVATLEPGEVRLVAWHDGGIDGLRVVPAASQARRATLVVAHLRPADLTAARADANLPANAERASATTSGPAER